MDAKRQRMIVWDRVARVEFTRQALSLIKTGEFHFTGNFGHLEDPFWAMTAEMDRVEVTNKLTKVLVRFPRSSQLGGGLWCAFIERAFSEKAEILIRVAMATAQKG
jgi:hypothetical protein